MKIFLALISLSTTSILCQDRQHRSSSKFDHFPATNQNGLDRPTSRQPFRSAPAGRQPPRAAAPASRQPSRATSVAQPPTFRATPQPLTIGLRQPHRSAEVTSNRAAAPQQFRAPTPSVDDGGHDDLDYDYGEHVSRFQLFKRKNNGNGQSLSNSEALSQVRTPKAQRPAQRQTNQPRKQNIPQKKEQFRTNNFSQQSQQLPSNNLVQQTQQFSRNIPVQKIQQFSRNNPTQQSPKKDSRFSNIVANFFSESTPPQPTQQVPRNNPAQQTQQFSRNNPAQQTQQFSRNNPAQQTQQFSRNNPIQQTQQFSRNSPVQPPQQFLRNSPVQQTQQFHEPQQPQAVPNNIPAPPVFTQHEINVNDQSPSSPVLLASFADFEKLVNSV